MFSIGNEELKQCPPLGKTIKCPRCGKRHEVKFANEVNADGTKEKSDFAFYKCGKKSYMCGIAGKNIMGLFR